MTNRSMILASASLTALLALFAPALVARADIFQWEYINPANPSQGKQQSTMLTAGAGNPLLSFAEDLGALGLTTMALLVPVIALAIVVAGALAIRSLWRRIRVSARRS